MNDDNTGDDTNAATPDDVLEEERNDTGVTSDPLAHPGTPDDPAMPADDVPGDNTQFDEPKSDSGVDSTEAYQEGEDQAAGDPQHETNS